MTSCMCCINLLFPQWCMYCLRLFILRNVEKCFLSQTHYGGAGAVVHYSCRFYAYSTSWRYSYKRVLITRYFKILPMWNRTLVCWLTVIIETDFRRYIYPQCWFFQRWSLNLLEFSHNLIYHAGGVISSDRYGKLLRYIRYVYFSKNKTSGAMK